MTPTAKALGAIFDRDTLYSLHDRLDRAARTAQGPAGRRAEAARRAIAAILDHDLPADDLAPFETDQDPLPDPDEAQDTEDAR